MIVVNNFVVFISHIVISLFLMIISYMIIKRNRIPVEVGILLMITSFVIVAFHCYVYFYLIQNDSQDTENMTKPDDTKLRGLSYPKRYNRFI
uniref:Uncharacterized protein n=1 Tax=viral metagenome TaxID=1070528 RepID=A0A6C0H2Q6_9ZZZZ